MRAMIHVTHLVLVCQLLTPSAQAAPMSLLEIVKKITSASTTVGIQKATLDATLARGTSARLTLLPTVTAQAYALRTHQNSTNVDTRTGELSADLNLFKFGGDYLAWRAAHFDESAAQATLDDSLLQTESEGAKAAIDWLSRSQQAQIIEKTLELELSTLNTAQERYKKGLLSEQEVAKVSIDLENARARLSDAQSAEQVARARVVSLTNDPEIEITAEWPWKKFDPSVSLNKSNFALTTRPDYLASQNNLQAQEARSTRAWRTLLPKLDANFTLGTSETVGSGKGYRDYWTGQLTLSLNVFDRWVGIGEAQAAALNRTISELKLEQTRRSARQEFDSARSTLDLTLNSARVREKTQENSSRLYNDARKRFDLGRIDANQLNTEQSRLNEAQILTIQGWADVHRSIADLCRARGMRLSDCI